MQTRQDINVADIVARFQDGFIKENDISHHYAYELNRSSFVELVDQLAQLLVVRKGLTPLQWKEKLLSANDKIIRSYRPVTVEIIHSRFPTLNVAGVWTTFDVDRSKLQCVRYGVFEFKNL